MTDFDAMVLRILLAAEWTQNDALHWICPTCDGEKPGIHEGSPFPYHAPGCELAKAIKILKAKTS